MRTVALDVVDPQHLVEVTLRSVRLAVPEADLAEEPARFHDERLVAGLRPAVEQLVGERRRPHELALLDVYSRETMERREPLRGFSDLLAQRFRSRVGALGRGGGVSPRGDQHGAEASLQDQLPAIAIRRSG